MLSFKKIIAVFLLLLGISFAEVPLDIRGQIQTRFWYSSETDLQSINYVYLYSNYNTEGICKFNGRFAWKYQSTGQSFDMPFDRFLATAISRSNIEISGNVFPNLPECKITIGSVTMDYSPFIAQNNYDRAIGLRGYKVSNLNLADISLDGFYGWHAITSHDRVGFGVKGQKKINNIMVTCIGTGTIEKRGGSNWNYLDQALSCEVNIRRRSGPINTMIAVNKKDNVSRWIKQLKTEGRTKNSWQYELELFDFDKDFDPTYRNKQEEYYISNFTTSYYGVNPLDRYSDRLGMKIALSGVLKDIPTKFGYQICKIKSEDYFLNQLELAQEYRFGNWRLKSAMDLEIEAKKIGGNDITSRTGLLIGNNIPRDVVAEVSFFASTSRFNDSYREMLLTLNFNTYGFKLSGGFVKNNNVFQKVLRGNFSSPLGITVLFGLSDPNIVEKDNFYYDKDGKLVYRDNFLLISHSLFF